MSLRFSKLHKTKSESILHYLLHTTIPTCICALFILLLISTLFLNPYSAIYTHTIESNPNAFSIGVQQTKDFTQEILMYLWFGKSIKTEISTQATTHMADVRLLFIVGEWALIILLILLYFLLKKKTASHKLKLFTWASASALTCVILTSALFLLGFNKLFLMFHKFLFSNNLWLFPSSDTLILYFPEYFFQTIATRLVICLIITTVILTTVCKLAQKQQRLSSSKPAQHI